MTIEASAKGTGGKLLTLEAGRFFAALAVLLYHLTSIVANFRGVVVFDDVFRPGHVGVPYFFVLSGFIIFHVHRRDIGHPGALGRFAIRRFIRIYPMFWMISFAMLAAFLVAPGLGGERALSPAGVVSDLLLLPHGDAILSISWTLRHEIMFYALFALAIWLGRRAFAALLLWIVVSFGLGLVWPPDQYGLGAWSVVASSLNLGFGLGIVTAAMLARPSVAPPWLWVLLGGGLLFGLGMMEWILGHHTDHSVSVLGALGDVGYLVASAVLIYGLAKAEEHWTLPFPALWKLLGGASYLIYLIHQPLLSVIMRVLNRLPALSPEMAFVLSAVVAVAVAVALHWTVERWILRRLQSFFALRAASAAKGPA